MNRQIILFFAVVGLALCATSSTVDPRLNSVLVKNRKANIVVSFQGDTNTVLERANNLRFASRGSKATFIKTQLEQFKTPFQAAALEILTTSSVSFHSSWITNRIYVKDATKEIVSALAKLPEVTEIREEHLGAVFNPVSKEVKQVEIEWGVEKVEAPAVWDSGVNGTGIVVAVIDTGARATHQRLISNWRGNYGWFDPINEQVAPTDGSGHGSHVTGSIVGSEGVGVAPGAAWIACAGCNQFGQCPEAAVVACGEWVNCPSLPDGSSPNCNLLADVVSSSWGFYGHGHDFFDPVVNAFHANGIIPIFAGGNDGNCARMGYPGSHMEVIAVGATETTDRLAGFSSRGPARNKEQNDWTVIKPDISAPGVDIVSVSHTSDFSLTKSSGTSMAAPHVAGIVALLLSKNSSLNYAQIKAAIYDTAERDVPLPIFQCGDTPPTQWPNNMFGHGRINALRAVNAVTAN